MMKRWGKRLSRIRGIILIILCLSQVMPSVVWADGVSARAAIFSNSTRGVRYYGKNIHTRVPPASTTKVMTALLVMENLSLNKVVTVRSSAINVQPTKLGVRPGERFRVADLLYAVLMNSANDASIVLAEEVAGSEKAFVEMMNRRARQLGAKHTKFINSNGLPSKGRTQYTTAYDMYLMFREALKYPFFRQVVACRYKTIRSLEGRSFALKNHNKILFFEWQQKLYGKTGYTRAAKQCFVGYTTKGKNDICIIAVFGATRRWEDIKHIVSKYGGIEL